MSATTVTLDRQAVIDLLVDATAAVDVIEGVLLDETRDRFTSQLGRKIDDVAYAVVGPTSDDGGNGQREELWADGERRARDFLRSLAAETRRQMRTQPLAIQLAAARFADALYVVQGLHDQQEEEEVVDAR